MLHVYNIIVCSIREYYKLLIVGSIIIQAFIQYGHLVICQQIAIVLITLICNKERAMDDIIMATKIIVLTINHYSHMVAIVTTRLKIIHYWFS